MTAGSRSPPPSAGSDPPIAYRSGLLPSPAAAAATRPPLQLLSAAATSVAGMRALLPLLLLLLAVCTAPRACGGWTDGAADAARGAEGKARVISRIAFGSCANQSTPQPIWDAINDFDPQLFIWLGDNIYGDNKRPFRVFGKERTIGPWKNVPRFFPASEQELTERYQLQKNNKGYSALRTRAQVIGTWDDHDYGLNDAGKEFMGKNMTQRLMLDFLDEALDSPRLLILFVSFLWYHRRHLQICAKLHWKCNFEFSYQNELCYSCLTASFVQLPLSLFFYFLSLNKTSPSGQSSKKFHAHMCMHCHAHNFYVPG